MKIVDEPAEQVEAELRKDEIEVSREPYDPGSRDLLSDFAGFLRSPGPGSTVTLFEDERGRVRYYTVARTDPQVAELRARVEELSPPDSEPPALRLDRIEKRLAEVGALEARIAAVDERLPALEAEVARIDELAVVAERLPELEARVERVPELQARIGELGDLRIRLERLERTRP